MDVVMEPLSDLGWDCPRCTLINALGTAACAACGWEMDAGPKALRLGTPGAEGEQQLRAAVGQLWGESTIGVLLRLVRNAAEHPEDPKFRGPVRKCNKQVRTAIVEVAGAAEVLRQAGFEEEGDSFMLRSPDVPRLTLVCRLLEEQEQAVARRKLAPVKRRMPKFDEDLLREVQAEARYNGDRWGQPAAPLASAPPGLSSSSATASPSSAPVHSLRLRVRLPLGGRMELEVDPCTTTAALGSLLHERTGVPTRHQRLRFGYPPRLLRGGVEELLTEAGVRDGEVLYLENLRDLFLGNLESGAFTMAELLERLPPGEEEEAGEESTGALFRDALAAFSIELRERNFWAVVRARMQLLVGNSEADRPADLEMAQVRRGLFVIQRLFLNHDPRERLALALGCLPSFRPAELLRCTQTSLLVDRCAFLGSVAPQVLRLGGQQLLSPVRVKYVGEPGEDAGGLTRDFFSSFATRLGDDEPSLWELTGRGSLQPTPDAVAARAKHPSGLRAASLYRACGRVFGMAVLHGCKLGRPLSRHFARLLVGDAPRSLAELQAELRHEAGAGTPDFRGGQEILDRPLAECGLGEGALCFAWPVRNCPQLGERELVHGGAQKVVTDANKVEWLTLLLQQELVESARPAADAFRQGLADVFGGAGDACPLLCLLGADDLIELWGRGGVSRQDVARWRAVTRVSHAVQRQAEWLFTVLEEDYDDELRGKVLQFATGASSMGREGLQGFTVEPADGGDERLPSAMTCGNMLQLPRYSCRAVLSERLRTAAEDCGSFQMA